MDSCCPPRISDPSDSRLCPACGHAGRRIEAITPKALLRPAALTKLGPTGHRFCATASCPVVYFGDGGTFGREDVLVPVFQKEPEGRRTVCYCFDVTEDQMRREMETDGASAAADRIKVLVRDDRCACEVRNPQGSCCLGNVTALLRSFEGALVR